MKTELNKLLESEQISEYEIIEMIQTYHKLVKLEILEQKKFTKVLDILGIEQVDENIFLIDENTKYEFGE